MHRFLPRALAVLLPFALSPPLAAQAAAQSQRACAAPVAPSGVLAPWAHPASLAAAADAQHLASATLTPGQAAVVTLLPTPQVHYPLPPGKAGGAGSYGGLVRFDAGEAGTYRVALATPAWIDVAGAGGAVASVAHGHGADCSGIHKIVDFPLVPGRYTLQLGANAEARTTMLIARRP